MEWELMEAVMEEMPLVVMLRREQQILAVAEAVAVMVLQMALVRQEVQVL
jgi:hypothetical protein